MKRVRKIGLKLKKKYIYIFLGNPNNTETRKYVSKNQNQKRSVGRVNKIEQIINSEK